MDSRNNRISKAATQKIYTFCNLWRQTGKTEFGTKDVFKYSVGTRRSMVFFISLVNDNLLANDFLRDVTNGGIVMASWKSRCPLRWSRNTKIDVDKVIHTVRKGKSGKL